MVGFWDFESYLAVTEQLVPLLAAEFALAVVLVGKSIHPVQGVGRVLDTDGHHVVGVVEAELAQSITQGCGRRSVSGLASLSFGGHSQAVPVRPRPRHMTLMGTVRLHWRRSMSVSAVKMSVTGFGVYWSR